MAVIKNNKTGMWEVRTYYKDLTGARKQKTKRGFAKKSEALDWERNFKLKENQSISMSFKSFLSGSKSRTATPARSAKPACGSAFLMAKLSKVLLRYF